MTDNLTLHYATIAQEFEELAKQYVDKHDNMSWSLVILHYAALHWMNTVFVKCGFDPNHQKATHQIREQLLNECRTGMEDVSRHYRVLKTWSTQVRYRGDKMTKGDYDRAFGRHYQHIKKAALEISSNADFPTEEQIDSVKKVLARNGIE